jgi:methionine biosynthesis protein MetW
MPKYHLDGIFDPQKAQPDDAHSILMRQIPPGSTVLELGCATGYLSAYMEQALSCRVTGLEYDAASVAIAQTRCSAVYQVNLDDDKALEPASAHAPYDVLLAAAVLEHLKAPEKLLYAAKGLLRPGARLIVSLPNIAHWQVRLKLLAGGFDYEDYGIMDRTHLRFFTLKSGRALLEGAGYRVESLLIAGSGLQNSLNMLARRRGGPLPRAVLPALLAYELIYVACPD